MTDLSRSLPLLDHADPEAALQRALAELSQNVTSWMRDPADVADPARVVGHLWAWATPIEAAAVIVCSALALASTPTGEDAWMTAVTVLSDFMTGWDFTADRPAGDAP